MSFIDRLKTLARQRAARVPEVALHPEGWVQYAIGDDFEVELTASPGESAVSALLSSRHRRLTPDVAKAPPGTVGRVVGLMPDAVMLRVPKSAMVVQLDALKSIEQRDFDTPDDKGSVLFGFAKPNAVPLTGAENQTARQWGGRYGAVDASEVTAQTRTAALRLRTRRQQDESKRRKQRIYRLTYHLRADGRVAFSGAYDAGVDAAEVSIAPHARVLRMTEAQLQAQLQLPRQPQAGLLSQRRRAAAADVTVEKSDNGNALERAVAAQAESIAKLTTLVERLMSAGWDAIQTEDRMIVLDPKALEAAPKKRWTHSVSDSVPGARRAAP